MSCIDAAIIAEMNKQKTSDANSITTKTITCNGKLEASYINSAGSVKAGTNNGSSDAIAVQCFGIMSLKDPVYETHIHLMTSANGLFMMGPDGKEKVIGWSQTITHHTNVSGEIGTFCEATGEIYDGYDTIDNTDCICKVRTASVLSNKIVGIITRDNEFASHGDVLVKVVPGSYNIGDILAPAENGYGRKATNEELQFMMLNSLPMVKITSINTGIANTVATFIR